MTPDPSTPRDRHVLVIEDDADIRHLLCLLFERQGVRATAAADIPTATEALKQGLFGLVCLDLTLQQESGLVLLKHIRQDPKTAAVPVVVITASASDRQAELVRGLGADAILRKPFEIDTIETLARRYWA